MNEPIIPNDSYQAAEEKLLRSGAHSILLVHGASLRRTGLGAWLFSLPERTGIRVISFSGFVPNPDVSSVINGIGVLRREKCDLVFGAGGGSAMDVAKCIRLYALNDPDQDLLRQAPVPHSVPLWLAPTTAGTGSEATRFAVIYENGVKQSVSHERCLPDEAMLDASALTLLPLSQRKATMMDALCHAVESCWSIHSTQESRLISLEAIRSVLQWKDGYLSGTPEGNSGMLKAAYRAGQAINITQTTAGHAMCYKLTGLYGLPHGQAAALCVRQLWPWMMTHADRCTDPRGIRHLSAVFQDLSAAFGGTSPEDGPEAFRSLTEELFPVVPSATGQELACLAVSVNPQRLKNNPVSLTQEDIACLYRRILNPSVPV